jgi:chromate transporter
MPNSSTPWPSGRSRPGRWVQTVAVVGYAAGGLATGLLAAAVAFAPSFVFILAGARHFDSFRTNLRVRSFLSGAGPASIGAIAGSALPLGLAIAHLWQVGLLAVAAVWLVGLRRNVVVALIAAGAVGVAAVMAGAPVA